jgi:MFS family permease
MKEFKLYKMRWLMLALFSLLGLINNAMWIFYAPITGTAASFYDTTQFGIDMLSATFMVMTIILTLPASWVCDRFGTRWCVQIAAVTSLLCGWIRWLARFAPHSQQYWIVFAGQMLGALGQPFLLPPPPKLATSWFGDDERVLATGAGSLAVVGGIATGYGMGMAANNEDMIDTMLLVQAVLGTLIGVSCVLFYREQPPTPPSVSASNADPGDSRRFWANVRAACTEWRFVIIMLSLGPGYGAIASLFTVMSDIATMPALGYSERDAGWFGVIMILVGLVSAGVIGAITDAKKNYRTMMIFCFSASVAGAAFFIFALLYSDNFALTAVASGAMGAFMLPLLPVGIDAAVEVTYPVPEGVIGGLIFQAGNVFGIVLLVFMELLMPSPLSNDVPYWSLYFMFIIAAAGAALVPLFRGPYKRHLFELEREHLGDERFDDEEVSLFPDSTRISDDDNHEYSKLNRIQYG